MMEILRRFEEEDNENLGQFGEDDGDGDEEEDDEDDIAKRLAGIDIASASPNLLWSLLSDSERAQFVKAIQDPSSALSQELLLSDELRREVTYRPWWEGQSQAPDDPMRRSSQNLHLSLVRDVHHDQAGLRIDDTDDIRSSPPPPHLPKPISIPLTMIQPRPFPNGPPLIYNLCAICFAYAYTTRRLGKSPLAPSRCESSDANAHAGNSQETENLRDIEDIEDIEESKRILAQLVPFLIKRKSAVLYSTVSDAIDDVWSKVDKSTVSTSTSTSNSHSETSTFSVLMQDTATLLRPQPIGIVSSTSISSSVSSNSSISSTSSSVSSPPGLTPSTPSSPSPSSPSSSEATAVAVTADVPSHPNRNTVYALSDLHRLFTISLGGKGEKGEQAKGEKGAHVAHKLLFYSAHVLSTPSVVLRSVADEVAAYAARAQAR
ncbi:hypothetical protein EV361DRAFT_942949 [Lentinula raphanica]|nr:hypothetical protein EV361DRAFT_942949 [Lentinula raphanica]